MVSRGSCGLARQGVEVAEVIRPNRLARRRGTSDAADAVAAALAALNGEASGAPKAHDGAVESIRMLRVARRGHQGLHRGRKPAARLHRHRPQAAAGATRAAADRPASGAGCPVPSGYLTGPAERAKAAIGTVARRHQALPAEIARLALAELVAHTRAQAGPGQAGHARQDHDATGGKVPHACDRSHPRFGLSGRVDDGDTARGVLQDR